MSRIPFILVALAGTLLAEPLSKKNDIDFFRDVPSRSLKGLATRSDGRLVAGPVLTELTGPPPADILWAIEPTPEAAKFIVGTGADGRILELALNLSATPPSFASREIAKLDDPQIFAVKRLADGSLLAGTSPKGALYLVRDGKPLARVALPVDSIFDLLLLDNDTALAATGNPGRIYRIDLKKFATVGLVADRITDTKILADRGITLFGEIRDRNVRRLARLSDGRIVAGSAPRGNVYAFVPEPGATDPHAKLSPVILQENRDGEVTDLLPQPNGELLAAIVFSTSSGESRLAPPPSQAKGGGRENAKEEPPPPAQIERFAGRSALVLFPAEGFPETLASRAGAAVYRIARFGDTVLLAGGEQGELLGYDVKTRLALTFAGSLSAQLNGLVPLAGAPGRFLILRNNAPGLAVLDFNATGAREAETRRLDLGAAAQLGALRFNRLRNVTDADLALEIRTSNGSDDVEGWTAWTPLRASPDGGWRAEGLRGRYAKLRLKIAAPAASPTAATRPPLEIDRASLFALPQNRRPQLQDFRLLTPGYGVLPASEPAPQAVISLNQLMQGAKDDDRRRQNFLNSSVVPAPGTQVVLWHVTDPDNDTFISTFSIRRDGDSTWTDIATATRESFAQFDTRHLPEGVYFTRLVATETAPRPTAERLAQTFETDDLIIDHTPPELLEPVVRKTADSLLVSVRGRDRLSLIDGIEVVFSNGVREVVEQPVDGVRDGREEGFALDVPLARVSNATSLELTVYDAAGNAAATRLKW